MPDTNGVQRESLIDKALNRKIVDPNAPVNLKKSTRFNENAIQVFLLFCGLLSILTTIGILYVLVSESVGFFTRDLWEQTNKPIAVSIDAEQTVFSARSAGRELETGERIRIQEEEMILEEYIANEIEIEITGTGAGFERFCNGEIDINDASRSISDDELAICRANNIEPVEFQIGTDAIAVVINAENDFATDLTLEELQMVFSGAEVWSDIRPEFPNQRIMRFIPGTDSGTFDTFVEVVFDGDDSPILGADATAISSQDLVTSEDDDQLVRGIGDNAYAVGFFGYSYYLDNADTLSAMTIDGVEPSITSVEDGTYLLGRPLFVYTSEEILRDKPQIASFISYYLTHVGSVIEAVGYFPASDDILNASKQALIEVANIEATTDDNGNVVLDPVNVPEISGNMHIAGSSTVFPITDRIADDFVAEGYMPVLTVIRGVNGTFPEEHSAGATIEIGDRVSLFEFFTGTEWQPAIRDFGIFPLVYGTLATSFIAMLVALPLGMGAAIYLSEYAPENVRNTVKPILEILAGIPTVVYGYFALTFMTPLLQAIFGDVVQIYNSTSAGIVVGILIIPMVSSMSEDALSAVPRGLREASYGLGATKLETTFKVIIPAALSGIMAAFIIAVSRAIGETMIVAIAAGAGPQNDIPSLLANRGPGILFEPAETMTGHIARISGGDLSYNSIDYNSIFAIGLLLFVITFALNLINNAIIERFREAY
ncbi:MAG: phosphate ABC transporter permease subunit PstC [Chloroflexota bacterium]